jgi:NAD(P)-dependent dehydrogenase (short-subunit alcohol dehydrogenase family)
MEKYTAGADPAVTILKLDVTDELAVQQEAAAQAIAVYGRIDILVNNAGNVRHGGVEDLRYMLQTRLLIYMLTLLYPHSDEQIKAQFDTNVFGTLRLTKSILPHFRQRKTGFVVFISSLSGLVAHPFSGAYNASKFALEGSFQAIRVFGLRNESAIGWLTYWVFRIGFAESLQYEVAPFGIRTLVVEPGLFRTKLLSPGNIATTPSRIPDYEETVASISKTVSAIDRTQPGDPSKAVSIMLDVIRGEGVAEGKETPFRLPLGGDCFEQVKEKLDGMQKLLSDWEAVIRSTDF